MEEIEQLKETIQERLKKTSSAQEFINSFPEDENNSMIVSKVETIPSEKDKMPTFLQKKVYSEEIVNFYKVVKDVMHTELYIEILGKNLGQTKEYFRIRSTFEERD
ncbi:MAG: hypothetical protein WCP92_09405 [bacterium]